MTISLNSMNITAIDFETANGSPASVCSVGLATLNDGVVEEPYHSLIRPADNVAAFWAGNIRIHGIHPQDVEGAPTFREVYLELLPYFRGALVCAHNAVFDMGCLRAACENCGLALPPLYWFDTLELSRHLWPDMAHHGLADMCARLDIELDHHQADSDAAGCLGIVVNAMNMTGIFEIEELLKYAHVRIHKLRSH